MDETTSTRSQLPPHRVLPFIDSKTIKKRVGEIGQEISVAYPQHNEPLLLVGILKGAAVFLADLVRVVPRQVEYDFVAVSSYGSATATSGEVRILKDLDASVSGKHVLIVEDILDTGLTLRFSYLVENLKSRNAKSVGVCVLLDKPSRRKVQVEVQHCGFTIPDYFVVGYGMDYAEQYRNLDYIGIVEFVERQDDAGLILDKQGEL